ncbi:uncharacterized protein HaLaN_12731 [Haematococcus lacustris]|uniref:Uncharacterized protein n=1 Tax=Haematococcus lacustris TaxID=44745 RepID=A0A699ZBR6_HAELA|nr:uncharacterized protein HaLaN_12731 [Haematococcus lacustris]
MMVDMRDWVFRTNSSYGRWDEARKMWGGLLNRSRDIMRQAWLLLVLAQGATLFPTEDLAARQALARWMVAFARALRIHFQPEVTLESELGGILTPRELDHTARFLVLWLSLLPFSLYGSLGPWTIPVVLATTAAVEQPAVPAQAVHRKVPRVAAAAVAAACQYATCYALMSHVSLPATET